MIKPLEDFKFEFWPWWKKLVTDYGIQPSQAWDMDFKEVRCLTGVEDAEDAQDLSLMLSFERKANGCPSHLI